MIVLAAIGYQLEPIIMRDCGHYNLRRRITGRSEHGMDLMDPPMRTAARAAIGLSQHWLFFQAYSTRTHQPMGIRGSALLLFLAGTPVQMLPVTNTATIPATMELVATGLQPARTHTWVYPDCSRAQPTTGRFGRGMELMDPPMLTAAPMHIGDLRQ